ncbi:MAG: hypothetical protein ACYC96_08080 [Fimbriimonadaceae bacterium]
MPVARASWLPAGRLGICGEQGPKVMERRFRIQVATLVAGVIVFSGLPQRAAAIPYFARKYKVTCARCHVGFPKLNTFGKNFQLHGYQQPGDKDVGKVVTKEDPNLSLPDQAPIAILIENQVALDKWAGANSPIMFNTPIVFHLFAADSLGQDIGIFAEAATDGSGHFAAGKVSFSISNIMDQPINFQVGNLDVMEHGVTEHDLFGRSGYAVQDISLGGFQLSTQHEGIRLFGTIGSPITPALIHGVTPGAPKAPAPSDQSGGNHGPRVSPGLLQKQKIEGDDDSDAGDPMDSMKGLLWEVGLYNSNSQGAGNGNGTALDAQDVTGRLNVYFDNDSYVGLAAYHGRTLVPVTNPNTTLTSFFPNNYTMGGVDFSLKLGMPFEKTKGVLQKPIELLGSYLAGTASSPNGDGVKTNWNGYFLEGDYVLGQKSILFVRYDRVTSADMPALELEHLTGNYTYYLRTNLYVGLEYTHDLKNTNNSALGIIFNIAY